MADSSVYPGSIDPDMAALVPSDSTPDAARDWMKQVADAVRQIEVTLGTNPSAGGPQVAMATGVSEQLEQATDSYAAVDDTDLRITVADGHASRMIGTCQARAVSVDASNLQWMLDDGSGTPLSDLVMVADNTDNPIPGLMVVSFVIDPAPEGEFQVRWGHMSVGASGSTVGTAWGGIWGPAILTVQNATAA